MNKNLSVTMGLHDRVAYRHLNGDFLEIEYSIDQNADAETFKSALEKTYDESVARCGDVFIFSTEEACTKFLMTLP